MEVTISEINRELQTAFLIDQGLLDVEDDIQSIFYNPETDELQLVEEIEEGFDF